MVTNLQLPECFVGTVTPTISERDACEIIMKTDSVG